MWTIGNCIWAPLLAKLFTAIATTGCLPAHFLHGSITPILKPGAPPSLPSSYRPITLLLTVYRIFARCLATRFGRAMDPAFGHEQSAYLPNRRIESAILFQDLLPHLLHATNQPGCTLFLDIVKAFDTVSRPFLFEVMTTMGCSEGMVNLARIILSDTWACTHANGFSSTYLQWFMGVRQGCPLSPLLYLFIPRAFGVWLSSFPSMGISIIGQRYVTLHHADDGSLHLSSLSPQAESDLQFALTCFQKASCQAVHLGKSQALILRTGPAPSSSPPTSFATIPLTQSLTSLGIPRCTPSHPPPSPSPSPYTTRSSLQPPISPSPPFIPPSQAWSQAHSNSLSRLHRIQRLPLSPIGQGLAASTYALSSILYLAEFTDSPTSPNPLLDIQSVAYSTVSHRPPPFSPYSIPTPFLTARPSQGGFGLLHVQRHSTARHAALATRLLSHLFSPTQDSSSQTSSPPPWIHLASHLLKHSCPDLHPAHTLLLATIAPKDPLLQGILSIPGLLQLHPIPPGPLRRMILALRAMGPLTPTLTLHTDISSLPSLSWPHPSSTPSRPLPPLHPVSPIPVRLLYDCLSIPDSRSRKRVHDAFHRLASVETAPSSSSTPPTLPRALRRAWRHPCPNSLKLTYWLLTSNSIPGGSIPPPHWRCPCSPQPPTSPSRLHSFWECPVALAVRETISTAILHTLTPQPSLHRSSLWLLTPPHPSVNEHFWTLVCLAALSAMDYGRSFLWCNSDSSPNIVLTAFRHAVAHFWSCLHSEMPSLQ